jgi:hypothetical protein
VMFHAAQLPKSAQVEAVEDLFHSEGWHRSRA